MGIVTYNTLRNFKTRAEQKKDIEKYWGNRFKAFLPEKDKRYIRYSVRI